MWLRWASLGCNGVEPANVANNPGDIMGHSTLHYIANKIREILQPDGDPDNT